MASRKKPSKKTKRKSTESNKIPKRIRLLNLANLLLHSQYGIELKDIARLEGYDDLDFHKPKDNSALRRRFQRDKKDLEVLGIKIDQVSSAATDGRADLFRLGRDSTLIGNLDLEAEEHLMLDDLAHSFEGSFEAAMTELVMSSIVKLKAGSGSEAFAESASPSQLKRALAGEEVDSSKLNTCLLAHVSRKPLQFDYRSLKDVSARKRVVEPWGVVRRGRFCYVVGPEAKTKKPRVFRLSRMRGKLKILEDKATFNIPKSFQLEEEFSSTLLSGGENALSKVGIRFDADVGFIVENDFSGTYPISTAKNQSVTMIIPSAYPGELFTYLSEFAGHFKVFTPPAMKRDFKARLQEVLTIYE